VLLINLAVISYVLIALMPISSSAMLFVLFPIIHCTGYGIFVTNLHLGNLFPKLRNLYVTTVAGAFDSAAIAFLIINKLYWSNVNFNLLALAYAATYFLSNIRTFLLTPKDYVPKMLPRNYEYGYKEMCSKNKTSPIKFPNKIDIVDENSEECKITFREFIGKSYYRTVLVSSPVMVFLITFYIANFNIFIENVLPEGRKNDANSYSNIFGIMQCFGIFVALLNGFVSNIYRRRCIKSGTDDYIAGMKSCLPGYFTGCLCVILMQICTLIPSAEVQFFAMVLQVFAKICYMGSNDTFMSMVLPAHIFGKLYGVIVIAIGLILLLQYPLTLMVTRLLDGNFLVLNICLTVISFVTFVHPVYVFFYVQKHYVAKETNIALSPIS